MLKIIRRVFSFSDWSRTHPRDPVPGDMLDAQFDEIIDRVDVWDAKIRKAINDDGKVAAGTVSIHALDDDFKAFLDQKLADSVEKLRFELSEYAKSAIFSEKVASEAQNDAVQAAAKAKIAESAVLAAQTLAETQFAAVEARSAAFSAAADQFLASQATITAGTGESEAWAVASALWAEHMPDTIPDNAVKIMDITGDHWSSRWWANQAANAFGMLTSLYLGAHPVPPTTNNNGGPIQIGSIYYDTTTGQAYVWDGSQWQSFYGVQRAGLLTLWYTATAGQTAFPLTVADMHGNTFTIDGTNPEGLDPHVNGVKLMPLAAGSPEGDWSLSGSTITFLRPLRSGDIVGIDVLMPVEALGPGAVENWKLAPLTGQDGVKVTFSLACAAGGGPAVTVNKNEELLVSLDGVLQEPTADYSASGASITFVNAPAADAQTFITWMRSTGGATVTSGTPVDWADITGKPATFPPTLPIAQTGVTNLVSDLSGKAPTVHTHAQSDVTGLPAALTAGLARANHTGTQSADTLTDGTTNKAFLATERTKLTGIATGATANSSDATLLARANHTGTQLAATISDFSTAADARVAVKIVNKITVASSAPGSPAVNDVWIDTT